MALRLSVDQVMRERLTEVIRCKGCVRTASGPVSARTWFGAVHHGADLDELLYECPGCGALCEWSFGGADDERCDDCVVADGISQKESR